MILSTCWQTQT